MRPRAEYLEGLVDLTSHDDPNVRRALFRQTIASIALVDALDGSTPLDALSPDGLLRSVQTAMADGLLDDLSWLAPAAASVALYEIAGALPHGPERRELGRRVLNQLYAGNAATFVALATRMAAGSARGLTGAGIRARVTLSLWLPAGTDVPVDPLALLLASRRELSRDWIAAPSTGSLPERRLAARLLERAAREATRRAMQGDDLPLRLFRNVSDGRRRDLDRSADGIALAWQTLLADREPLVWRHVAAARGLLAGVLPDFADEVRAQLAEDLSPTEWRRGAASLAASVAVDPDRALGRAIDLLRGPLLAADPGIATAMAWGLPVAADAEPEAADALLDEIARASPMSAAEAIVELRRDLRGAPGRGEPIGARAAARCARALEDALEAPPSAHARDDGLAALARVVHRDLSMDGAGVALLRGALDGAVAAFVETGPREAHGRALEAYALAAEVVGALEEIELSDLDDAQSAAARRAAVGLVRELDAELLGSGLLRSLLLLSRRPSEDATGVASLDDLDERLARWLLRAEGSAARASASPPLHVTVHQRNLRALIHLIDGESTDFGGEPELKARVLARWTGAIGVLLDRLRADRGSSLRRAIAASVARGLDALVREGAADAADIFLHAAMRGGDPDDLEVLGQASMHPDVAQLLRAYARFARGGRGGRDGGARAPDSDAAVSVRSTRRGALDAELAEAERARAALERIAALEALVTALPAGASQRTEIVRGALSRLARALGAVNTAGALSALTAAGSGDADASPLGALEDALTRLAQLTAGARRRCGEHPASATSGATEPLRLAIEVALQEEHAEDEAGPGVAAPIEALVSAARASIPGALADVVALVVPRILGLPVRRPSAPGSVALPEQPLPAWVPSRRTLGGFYVHRQLGGGSLGTVFVVTRTEERHDPSAERFALKVPEYDHTAARSVSEADFLRLFREEAGALLSLPDHPNLARFVTFDAGARPKPILVMELIEGIRCDKLLDARGLTSRSAVALLDGILAGLEAMHAVGVGHLDIKPTNVILRGGREPVLVDFGLAGRHIRPGCATGCYGAPEIWGVVPPGVTPTPLTADIYSFGCLAYEILTGKTLFDGPTEVALITAHVTHDGLPAPVKRLADDPRTADIAAFLYACLRHSPRDRATATSLREMLLRITGQLADMRWPVDDARAARHSTSGSRRSHTGNS
ncbi:protein kinase domain-containing protein [Sorangium sp. So ce1024]|uniref:protein kinase domain-containing protein n=1 Tax=unclassified Sorangium TaxID=2621164 RepID=UPI003F07DA16